MTRAEVLPGPGTVVRFGELVVWIGPAASGALVGFLLQSARNVGTAEDAGRQVADHVAGILASRDPEPASPFGAVGPDGHGGWVAVLHGPVQAWDGTRWLAPTPSPGWIRGPLTPTPAVSIGPAGSPSPRLVVDSPYDLEAGMVPGGGVILVPKAVTTAGPTPGFGSAGAAPFGSPGAVGSAGTTPFGSPGAVGSAGTTPFGSPGAAGAAPGQPPVAPPPTGADPFGSALGAPVGSSLPRPTATPAPPATPPAPDRPGWSPAGPADRGPAAGGPAESGPATAAPTGPELAGVACPAGHLNRPGTTSCATCGAPVAPDAPTTRGPRPSLGVLVADDGATYPLTSDLLFGAAPADQPAGLGGRLQPVVLTAAPGALAPAHAEIRLHDWDVEVVDRGAASGSYVAGEDGAWDRLIPFAPRRVGPGDHLSFGGRVLTYVSPAEAPGG